MVKRKSSVHGPACRRLGAGEGNTGLAFGIAAKLKQKKIR